MSFDAFLVIGGATAIATFAAAALAPGRLPRTAAALGGAGLLLALHAFARLRFRMDDAYVTYRYARNLSDGIGPVWNRGEHVEGYSSFLWMLLLAGMHAVGVDIEFAALLLACASMIGLFLLLWRISLRFTEGAAGGVAPEVLVAGVGLLVAANAAVGLWSMSGLETPLAAALIAALVLAYQRESRAPGLPVSALVLVAAVMTRPEMAFLAAATGALFLLQAVVERDARRWRHVVLFSATFVLLGGAWFAWRWSYYGYPYPNTYYVKVGAPSLMVERGWTYMNQYWWWYLLAPALLASVVLPFLVDRDRRRDAAFIAAISVVWIAAVVAEGGDAFQDGRFVMPIVAPLYLALLVTVRVLLGRLSIQRLYRTAAFGAVVTAAALIVVWSSITDAELTTNRQFLDESRVEGEWIRQNVPAGYVTAVYAAGMLPYISQRPSLDVLGLNDEVIAHTHVPNVGKGLAGHEKYNLDYVLDQRRPEIIIVGGSSTTFRTEAFMKAISGDQPGLVPGLNKLIQDSRTWERYEMAAFRHGDRWYFFLVRKDVEDNVHAGWIESKGVIDDGSGG